MKRKPALHISIPQPCKQRYEEMPASGAGKFCGECNRVIYNFSAMSDQQLFRFFEKNPGTGCGWFHNSQLERDINFQKPARTFYAKAAKLVASVLTVLAVRNASAAIPQKFLLHKPASTFPAAKKIKFRKAPVFITGIITDEKGNPIEHAKVQLDNIKTVFTDKTGNYRIEFSGGIELHNLYFSFSDLIPEVRSYHPAMGSTEFDVILTAHDSTGRQYFNHTGGVIMPPADTALLFFKNNSTQLSSDLKNRLNKLADKMKANPFTNIEMHAYPFEHSPEYYLAYKRMDSIKAYLVNKHGLGPDRISAYLAESYVSHDPKAIEINFTF